MSLAEALKNPYSRRGLLKKTAEAVGGGAVLSLVATAAQAQEQPVTKTPTEFNYNLQMPLITHEEGENEVATVLLQIAEQYHRLTGMNPDKVRIEGIVKNLEHDLKPLNAIAKAFELIADARDRVLQPQGHPDIPNVFYAYSPDDELVIKILDADSLSGGYFGREITPEGHTVATIGIRTDAKANIGAHEAFHASFDRTQLTHSPLYTMHRRTLQETTAMAGEIVYAFKSDEGDEATRNPYDQQVAYAIVNGIYDRWSHPVHPVQVDSQPYTHKQAISALYEQMQYDPNIFQDPRFGEILPYVFASDILSEVLDRIEEDEQNMDHVIASLMLLHAKMGHNYAPPQSIFKPLLEDAVEAAISDGHLANPSVPIAAEIPYQIVTAPGDEQGLNATTVNGASRGQVLRHLTAKKTNDGPGYQFLLTMSTSGLQSPVATNIDGATAPFTSAEITQQDLITGDFVPLLAQEPFGDSILTTYTFGTQPDTNLPMIPQAAVSKKQDVAFPPTPDSIASSSSTNHQAAELLSKLTGVSAEQIQLEAKEYERPSPTDLD